MKKEQLLKVSAQTHRNVQENGNVEYIVERYVNPKRPNLTALWVVNGTHEFKKRQDCYKYASRLAQAYGGTGPATMASYDTIIKTYTEEVYKAIFASQQQAA
jgi:hypothetical protein